MFNNFVYQCSRKNFTIRNIICAPTSIKTQFIQNPLSLISISRFFSNNLSNPQNFTVDYLTNSCGLSPESALKASKNIILKSTTGPDSVLSLLKSYGFTKPQISKIVTIRPSVLSADPDQSLKPKLEYFCNEGIAGLDLRKFISTNPHILGISLENTIIPSVNYLRSLVGTDEGVTTILNKSWWVLGGAERVMGSNIATLREHGVPQSNISKLLMWCPQSLYQKPDLIKKSVLRLMSMGSCPLSMMFLYGLAVITGMNKHKWDEKMAVYKSFGWSKDEVLFVFKKQPNTLSASVEKITLSLNFFLNDLQWNREDIARNPTVLLLNLKKRVIPRCRVLQILHSHNLITKAGVAQGLLEVEDSFLKKYVCKYHHVEPDLLKLYQGQKGTQGVLVGAKDGPELLDKI